MTSPDSAAAVWRLMFDFFMHSAPERTESLRKRGLTPNDARALSSLDGSQGRPIGELARQWKSDPSNTTWVVDRLEKAGLVTTEKVGRVRTCRLELRGLDQAAGWIERRREIWNARFDALEDVVEALKRKETLNGKQGK